MVMGAAFVTGTTHTMFRPLMAPYAVSLGASPFVASAVVAAFATPGLLLAMPVGAFGRRFGDRWVMIAGSVLLTVAGLVVGLLDRLPALFAGVVLAGAGAICVSVAMQGTATAPTNSGDLDTRRVAAFGTFLMVGQMVGPTLGGILTDAHGYAAAFMGVAVLGLLVGAVGMASRETGSPGRPSAAPPDPDVLDDVAAVGPQVPRNHRARPLQQARSVIRVPSVPTTLALSAVGTILLNVRTAFLPLYLDGISWSPSAIGALLSTAALAGLLSRGAFPIVERRLPTPALLTGCLIGSAAALTVTVSTAQTPVIIVGTALTGALLAGVNPVSLVVLVRLVGSARRQVAIGLRLTVRNLAQLVGPVMFGAVSSLAGVRPAFFVVTLLSGMASAGGAVSLRRAARPRSP